MAEVVGTSDTGVGVLGQSSRDDGVQGITSQTGKSGVAGLASSGANGVFGQSDTGRAVVGVSGGDDGVQGITSQTGKSGVAGLASSGANGVFGQSDTGRAVVGVSNTGIGVVGNSNGDDGVQGVCRVRGRSGVAGINTGGGNGVFGLGTPAGLFAGDVEVTGDIRLVNQDCAEDFDIVNLKDAEPGTVMVLDQNGALERSRQAYDKKVAGVISGAGDFRPGIILGKQTSESPRMPIALLGKVYCKVDARYSTIEVGDLLTTSDTPGHAMKAEDPQKAFGAVIGKALRPLAAGQGLIPILIALQ